MLSSSGWFAPFRNPAYERADLLAGRKPRTINMSTIGDDLLRPSSAAFGPRIEALIVYNSNPVAVAPESKKVTAGFAREDLFTVVLEHFLTDTADHADYVLPATTQLEHLDVHTTYGHTDVLFNEPAIAPLGQAKPNTQVFRELAARMGFAEACFGDDDEALARQALDYDRLGTSFEALARARLGRPAGARRAVRRWRLSDRQRPRAGRRAGPGSSRPCAELRVRRLDARAGGALSAGHDLAAGAQFPQLHLRQRAEPAQHRRRAAAGNPPRRRRGARPRPAAQTVRVFNDRGEYRLPAASVSARARPGVVNGLGVWWRKFGLAGTNVNQLTSQRLTDIGRAPTFYDCLVQVEALG